LPYYWYYFIIDISAAIAIIFAIAIDIFATLHFILIIAIISPLPLRHCFHWYRHFHYAITLYFRFIDFVSADWCHFDAIDIDYAAIIDIRRRHFDTPLLSPAFISWYFRRWYAIIFAADATLILLMPFSTADFQLSPLRHAAIIITPIFALRLSPAADAIVFTP